MVTCCLDGMKVFEEERNENKKGNNPGITTRYVP